MTGSPTTALLQQAIQLHRQGAVAEAVRLYFEILQSDPSNLDVLYRLAMAACQQGRYADGIDFARRALTIDPLQARTHNLIGMALSRLGRSVEALASFDAAIKYQPDFAEAFGNRANILCDLGRQTEAIASYDHAVALNPNSIEDWLNRGIALFEIQRDDEAIASYDRVIALRPNCIDAHHNRGVVLAKNGRWAEAVASFDRALAIDPRHIGARNNRDYLLKRHQGRQNADLQAAASRASGECLADQSDLMRRARTFPVRPRILVLKVDHIGDFVLSVRPLLELRKAWPEAFLTLVCAPWNANLAERLGIFDRILSYSFFPKMSGQWDGTSREQLAAFADLDLGSFDLAVDLRHDDDTRPLLDLVEATYRAGYSAGNLRRPLDVVLPNMEYAAPGTDPRTPLHAETRLMLLVSAIIAIFRQPDPHPAGMLTGATPIDSGFGSRPYIVVATGAGKPTRKWAVKNFSALCSELVEKTSAGIIFVGDHTDIDDVRRIGAALPADRFRDVTATLPLADLPGLLCNAALFVGNDSGPTHLASLLGIPTICVFSGASDPNVWRPIGPDVTVIRAPVPCSPCHLVQAEQCAYELRCLSLISVREVLDAAVERMNAPKSRDTAGRSSDTRSK
jgi:ADP-heptose:LPS heptosyltransferase/Flp pilus assembly protein TadD